MNKEQNSHIILSPSVLSLDTLSLLNIECLYALRNDGSMKVHVSYSTNLLVSLGRIMSKLLINPNDREFGLMTSDIETSVIDILTTDINIISDKKMKKLYTTLYTEQYKDKGYSLYKPSKNVKYDLRVCVKSYRRTAYYVVELVNARNDILVMGVFPNKVTLNGFIETYYPDNKVTGFHYDTSELTLSLSKFF